VASAGQYAKHLHLAPSRCYKGFINPLAYYNGYQMLIFFSVVHIQILSTSLRCCLDSHAVYVVAFAACEVMSVWYDRNLYINLVVAIVVVVVAAIIKAQSCHCDRWTWTELARTHCYDWTDLNGHFTVLNMFRTSASVKAWCMSPRGIAGPLDQSSPNFENECRVASQLTLPNFVTLQ